MSGREFQVIATTATLGNAAEHLRALTGMDFVEIGEEHNGAPSHGLTVLHIDAPECGAPAERAATDTIGALLECKPKGSGVIVFKDSRQGAERIVRAVDSPRFLPYRQGYTREDHRAIQQAIHKGEIDGVCATSALEAGIHLPQFSIGLTIGIPPSRKSLRQRVGRVGRTQPGVFIVQAPRAAFIKLGTTLADSLLGPVEPSTLYLENRYIQMQQACCHARESDFDGDHPVLESELSWPDQFATYLTYAEPGARRPRDLEETARAGLDDPHRTFGLRSMPSVTFVLKHARTGDVIGTIDQQKALREAAPGTTYFHFRQAYRVTEWRASSYENTIQLLPVRDGSHTQAILRCQVGASCEADALIQDHYLASDDGALFESQLRVVESVEGYRLGKTTQLYRDLKAKDRRLCRKQREFATTGVVIQIDEPWFEGSGGHQLAARRSLAEALKALLVHEHGIAPGDLQAVHTNIAIHSAGGSRKIESAVAVFDTIPGGLRLSAPLFSEFADMLDRLARGIAMAGTEALVSSKELDRLRAWHGQLRASAPQGSPAQLSEGQLLIYAPGSRVQVTVRGQSLERHIGEPQLVAIGEEERLMYRYEIGDGAHGWVADDQVSPSGNDWSRARWNPLTNVIEPLDAGR